jgi:CRP-like cAMP-binding protein
LVDRTSLYLNQPSDYYIDAIVETEVLILSPEYFEFLGEKQPSIYSRQNALLHNHISSLQKRITQLLGATAEERYVDFLKTYPNIFERVPQWMVASYLGITPESLSRVRKELVKRR